MSFFTKHMFNVALVLFLSLGTINSSKAQLVHPGGWHTQADLTQIRTKVKAKEEPWITGWNAIANESPNAGTTTNPSSLITSNGAMHTAGFNAWVLTMKWVASGDKSYSNAAIDIINTWVDTVRDFDVYGPTLTLSTGAGAMAQAAEVLEHGFDGEAGWNQGEADDAKDWFREIIYNPWTNTGTHRSTNWGTSALGGNMSMAIFMDDQKEYDYQRDAYLYGYQDTDDGCAAVTDYIFDDSGQAQETGRDQAHVQGGIAHLTETALCAWNQGEDLVSVSNNRLRAGVEYHAKYNLGYNDLPFTKDIYNPCDLPLLKNWDDAISEEYRGQFSPVYYMSSKLFTLAGLDHPYTKEVLTSPGYTPEINNFAHPGLGLLVFIPLSSDDNEGGQSVGFTPDPSKKYYIDVPVHNLRIGATGQSEEPFTTSTNTTGANVEWKFVSNGEGSWHIDRAAGGSLPRLRTDATEFADMQSTASDGRWESFEFAKGALDNTYFITSINGPASNERLQVDSSDNIKMVLSGYNGTWESFRFTEVEPSTRVVHITKRNATGFAIDGNRGQEEVNGQDVYLWDSNENNKNQQWLEIDRGNGYYTYQKLGTNFVLDGGNGGANRQNVYLWTIDEDNENQHWQKVEVGNGTYKLVKRNAAGFALDGGSSGVNGQSIALWNSSSTSQNIQWYITPLDGLSAKSLEVAEDEKVIIYPNPVESIATIQGAANTTVRIYDMNGKIVVTKNILNNIEEIDLSYLPQGIYYTEISSLQNTSLIKLIKN